MGCSVGKTIEKEKKENKGYPVCILTIPLNTQIDSMAALNKEKIILGAKNELILFEEKNKELTQISKDFKGRVNCLIKLSNDNIASGHQDCTIKIWDINKKEIISTLFGHNSMIWDIRELDNGQLISASDDNKSKIWNLKTKKGEDFCKCKRHISCIALLKKNNKVVLASGNNVFLYDLKTKEQESVLDINVWCLKALSNGDVAAGLGNGNFYILKITDEILIKTKFPQGHKKTINFIIELDNHKLVTSSDENDMILWDPNDIESMYLLKGHNDIVTSLCFICGTKFASASRDKTLKIWE